MNPLIFLECLTFSVFITFLTLVFRFILCSPEHIFGFYNKYLQKISDHIWLYKMLGGCFVCFTVDVSIVIFLLREIPITNHLTVMPIFGPTIIPLALIVLFLFFNLLPKFTKVIVVILAIVSAVALWWFDTVLFEKTVTVAFLSAFFAFVAQGLFIYFDEKYAEYLHR